MLVLMSRYMLVGKYHISPNAIYLDIASCIRSLFPDPPSKPGKPKATNWDRDFVELEWTKPKSDGGADITKYTIEKRDVVSTLGLEPCLWI